MEHSEADKGYLAGLIDGEGSVVITTSVNKNGKRYHHLYLSISGSDQQTLLDLAEEWEGTVYSAGKTRTLGNKPVSKLSWHNKNAAVILSTVRPYLRMKIDQADVGIKFASLIRVRGGIITSSELTERNELQAEMYGYNARSRTGIRSRTYVDEIVQHQWNCLRCGVEFKPTGPRQRYCSDECGQKYRRTSHE